MVRPIIRNLTGQKNPPTLFPPITEPEEAPMRWVHYNPGLQYDDPGEDQTKFDLSSLVMSATASVDGYMIMVGDDNTSVTAPAPLDPDSWKHGGVIESFDNGVTWSEPSEFAFGGVFFDLDSHIWGRVDCDVKIIGGNIVRAILAGDSLYVNLGNGGGWSRYPTGFVNIQRLSILDATNIYMIAQGTTNSTRRGRIARWNGTTVAELFKHDRIYESCRIVDDELFIIGHSDAIAGIGSRLWVVSDLLTTPVITEETARITGGDLTNNYNVNHITHVTPNGKMMICGYDGAWFSSDNGLTFQFVTLPDPVIDLYDVSVPLPLYWYGWGDYDATDPDYPFHIGSASWHQYDVFSFREVPGSNGTEWEQTFTEFRQPPPYAESEGFYAKTPQAWRITIYSINNHNVGVGTVDPRWENRRGYVRFEPY